MDAHGGTFNVDTNSVCCQVLYNTDTHERPMPDDRPESDRYQKEDDKFLSIFAY